MKGYKSVDPAVVELLHNKDLCLTIKSAANSYGLDNYSWAGRIADYELMYQSAAENAKANL